MTKITKKIAAAITLITFLLIAFFVWRANQRPASDDANAPIAISTVAENYLADVKAMLASHRKIIVLLSGETALDPATRQSVNAVGQAIFHEQLSALNALDNNARALLQDRNKGFIHIERALDFIESDADLFDADRLAFRELLRGLQTEISKLGTLPAAKLHKRISEDLDALADIEKNYEREVTQIFSRFETRAITPKREHWNDYLAHLGKRYTREKILKDYAVIAPYSAEKLAAMDKGDKSNKAANENEIFGKTLPPKTLVLTFDDGPHSRYTEEIEAILQQYSVPAVFFQVGRNLGTVKDGNASLGANAKVARQLMESGFDIANHSYSHIQLSKASADNLASEINNTDILLRGINPQRSPLFRFPYGARNSAGLQALDTAKLRSVMWNIDSLDWADPVPSSIADRVLRDIDKQGSGIVLFHDIHERTVKALPLVLDRLVADGYRFARWDGQGFSVSAGKNAAPEPPQRVTTGYNNSWAILVGIDEYTKWPRLSHAVRDMKAIEQTLIQRFGFTPDHVVSLTNAEATRNNILSAFHDKLVHGGMQKNDRVFVFFAGHGATRKLTSGRDLGYIVPVDADPERIATDGIAMSEIQNIAESLPAKHVLFVMDSCYSGLGLTRGGGGFLRENAKRIGRQMLTAGGADQLVADDGPNGHSIFTWTLLQALQGKADLNGDGFITSTELAAYIAPAVAGVSQQTPAFGSLPGSQGGEFVFELPTEGEFLSTGSGQLSGEAIALNGKLDAARQTEAAAVTSAKPAPVIVPDLQGHERNLPAIPLIGTSVRQQAQRANDRGLQFYREKRYIEAEAAFTEALKLRPDFALAANNLGFVFYKQNKMREAARWFEKTLQLDPSRAIAYINLGDAYAKLDEKEKARQAYKTYLELAPNSPNAGDVRQLMNKL